MYLSKIIYSPSGSKKNSYREKTKSSSFAVALALKNRQTHKLYVTNISSSIRFKQTKRANTMVYTSPNTTVHSDILSRLAFTLFSTKTTRTHTHISFYSEIHYNNVYNTPRVKEKLNEDNWILLDYKYFCVCKSAIGFFCGQQYFFD